MAALALLFLVLAPIHLLSLALRRKSAVPRRFLALSAWIVGARVRLAGPRPGPKSLIVANHVSWVDILVLGGATGCAFVSKDELGHGFVHWLADQNHTLYVRRSDRKGSKAQAQAIARAIDGPRPVAVFPEGTVGPGDRLLPFRSSLLEAIALAGRPVAVVPVAIDYGRALGDIVWHGKDGRTNVIEVLGRRGRFDVTLHFLDPIDPGLDRKAIAREAQRQIGESLASNIGKADLYAQAR